jgi:zinc resistance-associated protein
MWKLIAAGVGVCLLVTSQFAYAQNASTAGPSRLLSDADLQALTDGRIGVLKSALGLTPEQEKYWPAVEEAIRARVTARHQRLANLAARINTPRESNPIELLRERSDVLAQRAAGLKRLADVWQPLYESLDASQKLRLRFLTLYVLREMSDALESRRMRIEDEYWD